MFEFPRAFTLDTADTGDRDGSPEGAAAPASVDPSAFKLAMRELASHVSVVATGRGEERTGFTATSVTSFSAEPPALLVCLNRSSSSYDVIARTGAFSVNVLLAGQRAVADRFAGAGGLKGPSRYAGADWTTLVTGAAVLAGAAASFDCVLDELIERHTHAILIGRVVATAMAPQGPALLYRRGGYLAGE